MRTREVGEFLSGALAGAMTKAVLAPLETIRYFLINIILPTLPPISMFLIFVSNGNDSSRLLTMLETV